MKFSTAYYPLTKIENREILASKVGLSNICKRHGIISPNYIVYDHKLPFNYNLFKLRYPVLLKQDLSWCGGGILYCNDEASFKINLKKTKKDYHTIIQEYITGRDIGVEALYRNGELVEYNLGEVKTTEVAIFYRDIICVLKRKKTIELLKWVFNYKGYWRFTPTYDKKLFKKILKELWS